ncbi:PIN domain-containing protein [Actinorugispora endophytica]|uniref:Putative nucleic acid-binding protein n=1 Tax=Actinorugispora endophytica TaxID=1605990 RepID=A0A4R6V7J2_9ACTN|nr:PIN domain-containing protein [Actinorugispora endophytica]TDQ55212.1 putative nucleic acid-binding protein [Actinorugispora endophytica]
MKKTYLIDTSAWIEYLRATGSDTDAFVTELLTRDREIVTTEPIIAELLAGAKTPTELMQLERLTGGLPLLSVDNRVDYHELGRICRGPGSRGRPSASCPPA